mmetsp:Transcript_21464/g.24070  ORF Transcript_21464/g.24070 Transcript_21464/m.24070 type:complete len:214 (-) Transcript_21464:421-1062(-)
MSNSNSSSSSVFIFFFVVIFRGFDFMLWNIRTRCERDVLGLTIIQKEFIIRGDDHCFGFGFVVVFILVLVLVFVEFISFNFLWFGFDFIIDFDLTYFCYCFFVILIFIVINVIFSRFTALIYIFSHFRCIIVIFFFVAISVQFFFRFRYFQYKNISPNTSLVQWRLQLMCVIGWQVRLVIKYCLNKIRFFYHPLGNNLSLYTNRLESLNIKIL